MPPGRCLVLITENRDALWVTSWPFAEYVRHAWPGAWINSLFCNRGPVLSSLLIREAVSVTRSIYEVPPLGMVTFIDESKTRRRRGKNSQPGQCYHHAGFRQAICAAHMIASDDCAACEGKTKGGLFAVQMLPADMPEAEEIGSLQWNLFAA